MFRVFGIICHVKLLLMCIFEMIPNAAFKSIFFPTNLIVIELYHTSISRFIDVTVFMFIQMVLIIINFGTDPTFQDFISVDILQKEQNI